LSFSISSRAAIISLRLVLNSARDRAKLLIEHDKIGITLDEQLLEQRDVIGQLIDRHRHGARLYRPRATSARTSCTSMCSVVVYAAIVGCHVRAGGRQSMPSSSIDSCAAVSDTVPLLPAATRSDPLQPLAKQAQPVAAPPQQLHPIAASAAEDEPRGRRTDPRATAFAPALPSHRSPCACRDTGCQPDARAGGQSDHDGVDSICSVRRNAAKSTAPLIRMRAAVNSDLDHATGYGS